MKLKKIITIIGARPQFIKAAAVSRVMREYYEEILIHTGQHYDKNMSAVFFDELEIPYPDYNLAVGSKSQAEQTAQMMVEIEKILLKEKPEAVLVYGDTNSTLAGALAAVKTCIPVIHIEAGLRSYNKCMPEEINRTITDHISSILFSPTDAAVINLRKEGICAGVYKVGDVMCDTVLYYTHFMADKKTEVLSKLIPLYQEKIVGINNWYLATIHRAENTDTIDKLNTILNALEKADEKVIFSVHPRIRGYIDQLNSLNQYRNVIFVEPMGYKDMLFMVQTAKKVITDSGGLQKESYILKTPCVTIRQQTEWIETLEGNFNILADIDANDILEKLHISPDFKKYKQYYGDGNAAKEICEILSRHL
jgi:UDP-N-acetylglucosamine 2-epimerase (non-hydrolysing)/UDP-GlcNAc3NAcA epimerase